MAVRTLSVVATVMKRTLRSKNTKFTPPLCRLLTPPPTDARGAKEGPETIPSLRDLEVEGLAARGDFDVPVLGN